MLTFDQAKSNLIKIYNNPNDVYVVGNNGKLDTVSKWNVFGRVYHHIKGTSNVNAVRDLVEQSVKKVSDNVQDRTCFFEERNRGFFHIYRYNRSLSNVTELLLNKNLIKGNKSTLDAISALDSKCTELYNKIKANQPLFHEVFELPNVVSDMDNPTQVEREFQKYSG